MLLLLLLKLLNVATAIRFVVAVASLSVLLLPVLCVLMYCAMISG